ncbi:MAG: alpha/beta fold hydrolase [Candidatus Sericytochromatia bacterium]
MPRIPNIPGLPTVDRVPTGRVVDLPGRGSTYVVDSGPSSGPTYVLLHSLACTGLMTWCPVLDFVRPFGRVVVFDQRGHGQGISSPRFLLEDCADDVAAVADALGLRTFVPVGYSMGSLVAQLVWKRHPDRVNGLVLCAATTSISRAAHERLATGIFAALIEAFTPVPSRLASARSDEPVRGDHQWVFDQFRSTHPAAIARAIAELVRFDSRSWISNVDVPTSVVVTKRDRVFSAQRQKALAEQIPGAHTVVVDAGHARCTLQPDKFGPGLIEAVDHVHRRAALSA